MRVHPLRVFAGEGRTSGGLPRLASVLRTNVDQLAGFANPQQVHDERSPLPDSGVGAKPETKVIAAWFEHRGHALEGASGVPVGLTYVDREIVPMRVALLFAGNLHRFVEPAGGWIGRKPIWTPRLTARAAELSAGLLVEPATVDLLRRITWWSSTAVDGRLTFRREYTFARGERARRERPAAPTPEVRSRAGIDRRRIGLGVEPHGDGKGAFGGRDDGTSGLEGLLDVAQGPAEGARLVVGLGGETHSEVDRRGAVDLVSSGPRDALGVFGPKRAD